MNREDPYRDQAERLRQRIDRYQADSDETSSSKGLPPRRDIHNQKKKKTKWKIKYPVIRLLVLSFILLPIIIFSVYTYNEGQQKGSVQKVSNERDDFETVNIDNDAVEEKPDPNMVEEAEVSKDTVNNKTTDINTNAEPKSELVDSKTKAPNETKASPSSSEKDQNHTQQEATVKKQSKKIVYHKVQPSETMFRIAMKYYNSKAGIDKIRSANGIQGNEIQVGQVLKIPLNN